MSKQPKNAKGEPIRGILIVESGLPLHDDGRVNIEHYENVKKFFAEHPTLNDDYHVIVMPIIGAKEFNYCAHNLPHTPTIKIEELQQQVDEYLLHLSSTHESIVARITDLEAQKIAQTVAETNERIAEANERIDSLKVWSNKKS